MSYTFRPSPDRLKWWTAARFGVHITGDSTPSLQEANGCVPMSRCRWRAYQRYFDAFDAAAYDPRQWARLGACGRDAYAILTTKHHDGFCLFDSALTQYKATNTPARRDLVKEYVEAFRAEGLRIGLYYSLVDWQHPDYPAWQDRQHPMRHDPARRAESATGTTTCAICMAR